MESKRCLKELAYDTIKRSILSCEYEPGALLNEEMIQNSLNMSRTPIRDALSRLEQEGFITILPKKGIRVSNLTIEDINMIYEMRMILEPYALRYSGNLISAQQLMDFKNIFTGSYITSVVDLSFKYDDLFHDTILSVVPNTYLHRSYALLHNQIQRIRIMSGNKIPQRLDKSAREHINIIDACLNKDWDLAAENMRFHLEESKAASVLIIKSISEAFHR